MGQEVNKSVLSLADDVEKITVGLGQMTAAGAAKAMGKDEEAKLIAIEAAKTFDLHEKKKRMNKES